MMEKNKIITASMSDLNQEEQDALSEFIFRMVKRDKMEIWLSSFICAAESIHELTGKDMQDLMNFHASLLISAIIASPDCDAKNDFIDHVIGLLNTNRATKKVS